MQVLFLLVFDTLFQFHHSYKKFENRSVGGARHFQPFGICWRAFFLCAQHGCSL